MLTMLIIFFSEISLEYFLFPFSDRDINFYIFLFSQAIFNSERITEGAFEIDNGQVTAFHSDPDLMSASVDDEFEDDRYLPETYWTAEEREISDRSVPSSFE